MEYNFVVTDETTVIHDISLQTTLPETINVFGIKVEVPYDTSKLVLTDISGNNYTWSFPFDSSDFPDVVPNAFASAYFLDASGNSEEIKELIDASNLTFTATSTKTIQLFGIKVEVPYNTSGIVITDVSGDTYNWELPFDTTNLPKIGPNTVIASAFFVDTSGNTQEINKEFIAYNIGAIRQTRNYYVQLKANINKEIYQDVNGDYGIYGATIDKSNTLYDISYVLPTGSISRSLKTLPIYNSNTNELLGYYYLMIDISTTEVGEINSATYFTGNSETIVNSLNNYYSEKLEGIKSLYDNKTVITDWEMKLLDAYPSPNSIINYVNAYVGGTKSLPNFFDDGEHITLALGSELILNINDLEGNPVNIISPTRIYAVITQDSNAPRLNPTT